MKKSTLSMLIATAVVVCLTAVASAAENSSESESAEQDGTAISVGTVIVPEGLADGTYIGEATVEPDDDDGFNFYPIRTAVTVTDGSIESLTVSGAEGSNTQYSYRAETGISEQLAGKSSGEYQVDAVSMATCSSQAIVQAVNDALQNSPSDTRMSLSDAIYDPEGTVFTLTISSPEEDIDYSNISVSYAVGKFADELIADTDYLLTELSAEDDQIIYQITILPDSSYVIEDDDLEHSGSYNTIGQSLDITSAGITAGRVILTSGATATIEDNTLLLTGGNGETLSDYIDLASELSLTYTDASGEEVTDTYILQWQHDIEPEYTGSDFFAEDGSINFTLAPFVYGDSGSYTITVLCEGFADLTAEIGSIGISE